MRLFLLLLLFTFISTDAQANTNHPAVKKAESYLRGLTTARAPFIQTGYTAGTTQAGSNQLTGTFYLNRPGRLRFEYNEVDDFIVADGVFIYFWDSEERQQSNAPIGQTMADFFLRKDLRFGGDVIVQDVTQKNGKTAITIAQKDDPGAGTLQLFFRDQPYDLKMWRVRDAQGNITDVELGSIEKGLELPSHLFGYIEPKGSEPRYNE